MERWWKWRCHCCGRLINLTKPFSSQVATDILPEDRAATREDADRVMVAKMRNKIKTRTAPVSMAESMAAAATLSHIK